MKNEKYKLYSLYAFLSLEEAYKYTDIERAKSSIKDDKRGLLLMYGERIEHLDALTARYEDIEDLLSSYIEEVYGNKSQLYNPIIIVDKDAEDRSKSYAINEIVFQGDSVALQDQDSIRTELKAYLLDHPDELLIKKYPKSNEFRGISNISTHIRNKYPNITIYSLVEGTLNEYFKDNNYKRYREAYFTLKRLSREREIHHAVHK